MLQGEVVDEDQTLSSLTRRDLSSISGCRRCPLPFCLVADAQRVGQIAAAGITALASAGAAFLGSRSAKRNTEVEDRRAKEIADVQDKRAKEIAEAQDRRIKEIAEAEDKRIKEIAAAENKRIKDIAAAEAQRAERQRRLGSHSPNSHHGVFEQPRRVFRRHGSP
jgi:hypothetical protein